jgi:hypothetical protein
VRSRQNPGDEAQRQIRQRNLIIARPGGKQFGQQIGEPVPVQKAGEGEQSGLSADLLIGETKLDGPFAVVELKLGHCLVSQFLSESRLLSH